MRYLKYPTNTFVGHAFPGILVTRCIDILRRRSMVGIDCLAALDCLIWLRTGSRVAARLNLDQSNVSRNSRRCADVFRVSLERRGSEWQLGGDLTLINLQRHVHQLVRWRDHQQLRLDAQHWSGPLLCPSPPGGWIAGNFDFMEYHRPLQLLRDRVIDAWIASYPDVPGPDDPDVLAIPLSRMPALLVVKEGHPLLGLGDQVGFDDIACYPFLSLPEGAFPVFQRVLEECGLWTTFPQRGVEPPPSWRGKSDIEDLLVCIATPLTMHLYGDSYRALPLRLPVQVGDALVVGKEFVHTPQVKLLAALLRRRIATVAADMDEVLVLDHPTAGFLAGCEKNFDGLSAVSY